MIRKRASSTRLTMLAVALVVTAAVALVAGVAVTSANSRATVTLKLLAQANGQGNPQLQAIIDKFMQLNPDIKVEATYLPIGTTYANTLRTQLQSGNAPDVFYVTAGTGGLQSVLPLAKAGYVADLSKQPWVKTFPLAPANRPLYWRRGVLTALPFDVVPVGVMYNTEVMAGLGLEPPKTQTQFLAACRTAKSKGKHFLNLAGASAQNASLFATVVATSTVLAKDPGWNLKRLAGKTTFAGTPTWRAHAPAHRRHEERRLLPAGRRGERQHPGDPGLRLGPGRELDAADVDRRAAEELQHHGEVQLLRDARHDRGRHPRQRIADGRVRRVVEVLGQAGGVQVHQLHVHARRHGALRGSHRRRVAVPGRYRVSTSSTSSVA